MDSLTSIIIPLSKASESDEKFIGGKAFKLGKLAEAGFRIPDGICITTFAYQFIRDLCQKKLGKLWPVWA